MKALRGKKMTKLEELRAAYDAAYDAAEAAYDAVNAAAYDAAEAAYDAANAAAEDARAAYAAYDAARYAELKKQKEKQNDLALSTNEAHGT